MITKKIYESVLRLGSCMVFFGLIAGLVLGIEVGAGLAGFDLSELAHVEAWSNPLHYVPAALLFCISALMFGIAAGSPIPVLESFALTAYFALLPNFTSGISSSAQSGLVLVGLAWLVIFLLSILSRFWTVGSEIRWGVPSVVEVPLAFARRVRDPQSPPESPTILKANDAPPF